MRKLLGAAVAAAAVTTMAGLAGAQQGAMTFFVSSAAGPQGANFGGLTGADAHCQTLAQGAGAGGKTWRAYLSTQAEGTAPAVNARDRIGKGPWSNAKGVVIAKDVADLHGQNALTKATALSEKGTPIKGRGDTPNEHDVLTGSQPDGTAFPPGKDMTCGNWTKGGKEGGTVVGHSDRTGLDESAPAKSWNSSHETRGGCDVPALNSTGGAGYLYCFAAN